MPSSTPAIEFHNVSVTLPSGRTLLRDFSCTLDAGTTTAILGRSGSGKTTLLRTINRMIEATSGNLRVQGNDIRTSALIPLRRSMGYVIQETGLFPHFTVERNVSILLESEGLPKSERSARSRALLAKVGLDPAGFAQRYPHQLSGGQRQRVGVARALATDPAILLMDEPFGALDPLTRAEMQDMVLALFRSMQKTVVLVTHDLDEALFLADRILLLEDGGCIADLPPDAFLASQQAEIRSYIRAFHRGQQRVAPEAAS